ncbi:hypothetical protein, partial [Bacillus pseudomycoides]|uniref:hypothetical protein n=3 Tax=Bacillus pseudomycoides TaxID=64104 RepID=UPI002E1DFB3B|nr:hypothetical protein [Bacillus pseudomycoides]
NLLKLNIHVIFYQIFNNIINLFLVSITFSLKIKLSKTALIDKLLNKNKRNDINKLNKSILEIKVSL